jgi:transcriptional regulator with XRE-family HTH domain
LGRAGSFAVTGAETQQQIAEILGTSQTMYARYERGANELPIRHLLTLCNYYGVSADYILGRTDNPKTNK